ncbi:RNA polymerase sigma factor [Nocardiopsis ganjiahuensis]|uniref:RNA polymerase sigma factor n=1 Tax=Nocardiopsis ganjiahuensis TaxID=239984 RepID=UPI000348B49D|nr:sigma-70 family RNA polymerase sigma factor [Nocardiopsis ganjiahuensis]
MPDCGIEDLWRELAPQVLGALVRRYGNFDTAEDAVQEALLAAAEQWPEQGPPEDPRAWLITVASRRMTDLLRRDQARRRREERAAEWVLPKDRAAPPADRAGTPPDDTLVLLFLCCHPSLPRPSQIALTLRAVGGLETAEIARAFLVSEDTMTRRISRAKQRIREDGLTFRMPPAGELRARLDSVLHVLYLVFTEGYAATSGPRLLRAELSAEAVRLTRLLRHLLPEDGEVTGLLALMLLTDARRAARTGPGGEPVPMAEQDRGLWDAEMIAEGVALVEEALSRGDAGAYQLQAAIAALHDEAPCFEETDWPQIRALYGLLAELSDNPVVSLNHAVAVAMAEGPEAGLRLLAHLAEDGRITRDHRFHAARAHLAERSGDRESARRGYLEAARLAQSLPHQRYLNARAARLEET